MIYSAIVTYGNTFSVVLVGAEDYKKAMDKVMVLHRPHQVTSVKLEEIPRELLDKLESFYIGGKTLGYYEDIE